jgi:hypothetical protein
MTVDVNVLEADDTLLDDFEEIMDDTMVQLFILQPRSAEALEAAKAATSENALFYAAPLSLKAQGDANCVGYFLDDPVLLDDADPETPLFIDGGALDTPLLQRLAEGGFRGIILDASAPCPELKRFYLAIGPGTVDDFDPEALAELGMDRIVLQSGYPEYGFEHIHTTAKRISDQMFRPEQSIIANATRNALTLLGFKK